jgi:hypothetical protein
MILTPNPGEILNLKAQYSKPVVVCKDIEVNVRITKIIMLTIRDIQNHTGNRLTYVRSLDAGGLRLKSSSSESEKFDISLSPSFSFLSCNKWNKLAREQRKSTIWTSRQYNEKVSRTFWVPPRLRSSAFLTFDFLSDGIEHFLVHISWDVYVHECLFLSACGTQDFAEKQWTIEEVTWMIAGQADQCAGLNNSTVRARKKPGRKAGWPAASEREKTLYQFRVRSRILNVKTDSPQKALSNWWRLIHRNQ